MKPEDRAVAPQRRYVGVVDQRLEIHRQVVRNIVVLQMGVDVGVDDLQHVERTREDDTQVAVAAVVVPQVLDEVGRIAAPEFVGRAVRIVFGVLLIVGQQGIRPS